MSYNTVVLDPNIYNYDYFQQDDVCRLCWNRDAITQIMEISPENRLTMKTELFDKIIDCFDIDLSRHKRPNRACAECCKKINMFYNLKIFLQEKETKLREITRNQTEDIEQVETENNDDDKIKSNTVDEIFEVLSSDDNDSLSDTKKEVKIIPSNQDPKSTPTYCNKCMIECGDVETFNSHNQLHGIDADGLFKCFGCGKKFKTRKTRFCHETNFCKRLKDGYKCSICDRYLLTRGMYEAHTRDHRQNVPTNLPVKLIQCHKCDKTFSTMEKLQFHLECDHMKDRKIHICYSCGQSYTRTDSLHRHKLTHRLEEDPVCTKDSLNKNKKTRRVKTDPVCTKDSLNKNKKTRRVETDPVCTKDSLNKNTKKRRVLKKAHVCPHCDFRTLYRSSLVVHIRKHTGEKPYKCDRCNRRYPSKAHLISHEKKFFGCKNMQ